jgi:hypothetical protein
MGETEYTELQAVDEIRERSRRLRAVSGQLRADAADQQARFHALRLQRLTLLASSTRLQQEVLRGMEKRRASGSS